MDVGTVTQEIVDLHEEFERWFHGMSDSLGRVESALAAGFVFCATNGDVVGRDQILGGLRQAHNSRGFGIAIEHVQLAWQRDRLVGATYVEVHTHDHDVTRRRSSCVLEADEAVRGEWRWLSVHETWIDPPPVA